MTVSKTLNVSFKFRKQLRKYTRGNEREPQMNTIRPALNILDLFEIKLLKDQEFRERFYNWLIGKTSTIELRELAELVGIKYFGNLEQANAIDTLDSVQANFKL